MEVVEVLDGFFPFFNLFPIIGKFPLIIFSHIGSLVVLVIKGITGANRRLTE